MSETEKPDLLGMADKLQGDGRKLCVAGVTHDNRICYCRDETDGGDCYDTPALYGDETHLLGPMELKNAIVVARNNAPNALRWAAKEIEKLEARIAELEACRPH